MGAFYKVRMIEVSGPHIASAYSDSHSSKVTGARESQRTWSNVEKLGAGSITSVYQGTLTQILNTFSLPTVPHLRTSLN